MEISLFSNPFNRGSSEFGASQVAEEKASSKFAIGDGLLRWSGISNFSDAITSGKAHQYRNLTADLALGVLKCSAVFASLYGMSYWFGGQKPNDFLGQAEADCSAFRDNLPNSIIRLIDSSYIKQPQYSLWPVDVRSFFEKHLNSDSPVSKLVAKQILETAKKQQDGSLTTAFLQNCAKQSVSSGGCLQVLEGIENISSKLNKLQLCKQNTNKFCTSISKKTRKDPISPNAIKNVFANQNEGQIFDVFLQGMSWVEQKEIPNETSLRLIINELFKLGERGPGPSCHFYSLGRALAYKFISLKNPTAFSDGSFLLQIMCYYSPNAKIHKALEFHFPVELKEANWEQFLDSE